MVGQAPDGVGRDGRGRLGVRSANRLPGCEYGAHAGRG